MIPFKRLHPSLIAILAVMPLTPRVSGDEPPRPTGQAPSAKPENASPATPPENTRATPYFFFSNKGREVLVPDGGKVLVVPDTTLVQDQPALGFNVAPPAPALLAQMNLAPGQGVVVTAVAANGPAANVLKPHDLLVSLGGKTVRSDADLSQIVAETQAGRMKAGVYREGQLIELFLQPVFAEPYQRFVERQLDAKTGDLWIGVELATVDETLRRQLRLRPQHGLIVLEVLAAPHSPAAQAGIQKHDVLLTFQDVQLNEPHDLSRAIQQQGEKPATIDLVRRGQSQQVTVTPARREPVSLSIDDWTRAWLAQTHAAHQVFDEATFARRIFLDLLGLPPTVDELREFLDDQSPDARARLIQGLLDREDVQAHLSKRFVDIIRQRNQSEANRELGVLMFPQAVIAVDYDSHKVSPVDPQAAMQLQIEQLSQQLNQFQMSLQKLAETSQQLQKDTREKQANEK